MYGGDPMRKTKILGIAPYEGMRSLMHQTAEKREDVSLTVFVGDLEAGAEIAAKYGPGDFDVILSRGGTAELIRRQSALPVVEIPLSVYDILRSIKLAENNPGKYAIVGFPSITKNAHFLCDILQYDIDIRTIHNEAEARETLNRLANGGYNMILCDVITNSLAQAYGIPALLIVSGSESMESAFEQAIGTSQIYRKLYNETAFYKTVLEENRQTALVFDGGGALIYQSKPESLPPAVMEKIEKIIPSLQEGMKKKLYCDAAGKLYALAAIRREIEGSPYTVCYAAVRKTPLPLEKHGVYYTSRDEAFDHFFNSFYGITQSTSPGALPVEECAQSVDPVMIIGEFGTGKDQMVRLLYGKSRLCENPLVTIDCARIQTRGMDFLMENESSPLADTGITIYFKNTKTLSESQFLELFSTVRDLRVQRRCRLLFTYPINEAEASTRCRLLVNWFSCLTLTMPPLRSHKEEIPGLASLYISILNMRAAKEVIGFEPKALQLLEDYDWPDNYDQFKRILKELVTMTDTPYISLSSVRSLLHRETSLIYTAEKTGAPPIALNRTLEEINQDIIRRVLSQENGNQSAAAKRLGISRTTFWRMLQKPSAPLPEQADPDNPT